MLSLHVPRQARSWLTIKGMTRCATEPIMDQASDDCATKFAHGKHI